MIKVEDLLKFYNWNTTHISMGKCHQLKEEGYLHMKKHVKYPLYLLNYTSKTQYQQKWCYWSTSAPTCQLSPAQFQLELRAR